MPTIIHDERGDSVRTNRAFTVTGWRVRIGTEPSLPALLKFMRTNEAEIRLLAPEDREAVRLEIEKRIATL